MGWISKAKEEAAVNDAREAFAAGRHVYMWQNMKVSQTAGGVAEIVEAIEAEGWRLDQMSYFAVNAIGNFTGVFLFKRSA